MKHSIQRKPPIFALMCLGFGLLTGLGAALHQNASADEPQAGTASQAGVELAPDTETRFVRFQKNDRGEDISLDTAIAEYTSADGTVRVTLIGAVHIGEAAYYRTLNERFTAYDVVLYEVVAEEGTRPQQAQENRSVIGGVQRSFAGLLGLTFQIGSIDYTPENMLHADMTPDEFRAAMKKRDESFLVWYFRTVGYQSARTPRSAGSGVSLLTLLASPNKRVELKRLFAAEMDDLDSAIVPIEGESGSAMLTDRNEKVLGILREQLASGKKNVAIFYGAAHLPHFAERLTGQDGFTRTATEWLQAWDLTR